MGPAKHDRTINDALLKLNVASGRRAVVKRSGEPAFYPYKDVLSRAKACAGTLQARGFKRAIASR